MRRWGGGSRREPQRRFGVLGGVVEHFIFGGFFGGGGGKHPLFFGGKKWERQFFGGVGEGGRRWSGLRGGFFLPLWGLGFLRGENSLCSNPKTEKERKF